ncbi:cytochrome P450 [Mycolicibacterium moriokaense]|nr:cytochrome P450 [Mycolicibacterium moriokaense]
MMRKAVWRGDPVRLPLESRPGTSLPQGYVTVFRKRPTLDVELPDGTRAVAVSRQRDVRTVLSDDRFSRAQFHGSALHPGSVVPLALANSDPPIHTRRRRAIQRWFTGQRAQEARPLIERIAHQLVDELITAGPPADLYALFCHPFPNLVHMNLLGLDTADLPYLSRRVSIAWSSGRYCADDVDKAVAELRDYFNAQLSRARGRGVERGLIGELAQDDAADRLTDAEIVMLTMGLFMSGAETTSSHLALELVEILQRPGLRDALRRNPSRIPAAVEELLRWVWFGGTDGGTSGCAHVAVADVKLRDRLIPTGDVVIPVIDVANRDPDVFPDADEFRPQRGSNPHLGFGYGRHRCVGMAFARVELQVGLRTLLSRLDGLTLAHGHDIDWCTTMFTRGVRVLPVTWGGGGK